MSNRNDQDKLQSSGRKPPMMPRTHRPPSQGINLSDDQRVSSIIGVQKCGVSDQEGVSQ